MKARILPEGKTTPKLAGSVDEERQVGGVMLGPLYKKVMRITVTIPFIHNFFDRSSSFFLSGNEKSSNLGK